MKTKHILLGLTIFIIGLIAGRYLLPSGSGDSAPPPAATDATDAAPTIQTCSMHPQIQQPEPGDCPICGMDLIPRLQDEGADLDPRELSMSESSRALADIQTTEVRRAFPSAEIRLVGQFDYDETQVKSLTARFPARIERLFVNFTGVRVERGEHLAEVYSPELLTAQRELISAYQRDPDSSITAASREKLRLWDLLPEQIESILENGQAKDRFELRAPISGVVVMKKVNEGEYVKTGEPLFKIVDLSELWLYLDAYESDLFWLRCGQQVEFTVESNPGETFSGKIAFIEPELNRKTRTIPIRVNVPNQDGRLKPGMFARGIVESRITESGGIYAPEMAGKWVSPMHPQIVKDAPGQCDVCGMDLVPAESLGYVSNPNATAPLLVPASAVLRTGKRSVVYVKKPNTERPTFEGREIVLGSKAGDEFIVESGLSAGDRVVTQGAFKIDSALQIQAKPSMMNPEGGGPTPGHDHGGTPTPAAQSTAADPYASHDMSADIEIPTGQAAQLMQPYLAMQSALASDDLDAAKAQAKAMMATTGHSGKLPELLHDMLAAKTLEAFRKPHFESLSNALIMAAKAEPDAFDSELYIMHCPMVYSDRGADWLQDNKELQNPYFGSAMLTCGEVKNEIKP